MYQCLFSTGNFFCRCNIFLMLCWAIVFGEGEAKAQVNFPCPNNTTVSADYDKCDAQVDGISLWSSFYVTSYAIDGIIGYGLDASGQRFDVGTSTVTYTYIGRRGRERTCNFDVTVLPRIIMPDNQERNNDKNECYYTVNGKEFDPVYDCNNMPGGFDMINDFNSKNTLEVEQLSLGRTTITWTFLFNGVPYDSKPITITVYPNIEMPKDDQKRNNDEDECYYTVDGKEFDPVHDCNSMPVGFTMINDINLTDTLEEEQLPLGKTMITWTFLYDGIPYDYQLITITVYPNIEMPNDDQKYNDINECSYKVAGKEFDPVYDCNTMPVGFSMINNINSTDTLEDEQLPPGETMITWTFLYDGMPYRS